MKRLRNTNIIDLFVGIAVIQTAVVLHFDYMTMWRDYWYPQAIDRVKDTPEINLALSISLQIGMMLTIWAIMSLLRQIVFERRRATGAIVIEPIAASLRRVAGSGTGLSAPGSDTESASRSDAATSRSAESVNASIDAMRLRELRSVLRFNLLAGSVLALCELFLITRLPEWLPRLFWMIMSNLAIGILLFGCSAIYLSRLYQQDIDKLLAQKKGSK